MLGTVHWSEWVVFYDKEIVIVGKSFQEVADFAVVNYGRGAYLTHVMLVSHRLCFYRLQSTIR